MVVTVATWVYCLASVCSVETYPSAAECAAKAPAGYECVRLEVGTDEGAIDQLFESLGL